MRYPTMMKSTLLILICSIWLVLSGAAQATISGVRPQKSEEGVCGNTGSLTLPSPKDGLVQVFWPGAKPVQRIQLQNNRKFSIGFWALNCLGRDLTAGYVLQFFAWNQANSSLSGPLRDAHIDQQLMDSINLGGHPLNDEIGFTANEVWSFVTLDGNAASGIVSLEMPVAAEPGRYSIIGCPTKVPGLNDKLSFNRGVGASLVCGVLATVDVPAKDDVGGGTSQLDWGIKRLWLTKANATELEFARQRSVLITLENTGPTTVTRITGRIGLSLINLTNGQSIKQLGFVNLQPNTLLRPRDRITLVKSITVPDPRARGDIDKYRNSNGTVRDLQRVGLRADLVIGPGDTNPVNNTAVRHISLVFAKGCEVVFQWSPDPANGQTRLGRAYGRINWDYINLGSRSCGLFRVLPQRRMLRSNGWSNWESLLDANETAISIAIPSLDPGQFFSANAIDRFIFRDEGIYEYGVFIQGDHPDRTISNHETGSTGSNGSQILVIR